MIEVFPIIVIPTIGWVPTGQVILSLIVCLLCFAVIHIRYLLRTVLIRKGIIEQTTKYKSRKLNIVFLVAAAAIAVGIVAIGWPRWDMYYIFYLLFLCLTGLQIVYFLTRTVLELKNKR